MKKLLIGFLVLLCLGSVWYFFIKPSHYNISFESSSPPGVLYNHIYRWDRYASKRIDSVNNLSFKPFSEIQQQLFIEDTVYQYRWKIEKEKNQKTQVSVAITDNRNPLLQKLNLLLGKSSLKVSSIENVKNIGSELKILNDKFKVHSIKDTVISAQFCAYLSLESDINQKASAMLGNIPIIMGYINENNLELTGDPFLEVTSWERSSNQITFDFCFPIAASDSLPPSEEVKFKQISSYQALKAEFNGNYSISNNAWYHLIQFAEENELKIEYLPREYYLDDPHVGGDPLRWKAHILLPLRD